MDAGKTLHGSVNLAFDATDAITHIVEGMYRNIAAAPLPLGRAPQGSAPGIAGLVHQSIRLVNGATRGVANAVLGRTAPVLDRAWPSGPYREAAIAALNGVCGDHLERSGNPLAIPMALRVLLPVADQADSQLKPVPADVTVLAKRKPPFSGLFDTGRRAAEVYPRMQALAHPGFAPGRRLLLLVHGLSMNDSEWTSQQHNHAEALRGSHDYTPVYVLYNSGRHISTNGRELSEQLTGLLEAWPVPIDSITVIGFSMGGLVARSAMHIAAQQRLAWLDRVDKAVYIGTPHHGAALERGGFWLQKGLTFSPYTSPLAALGRLRSDGITDLRHGNVQDQDWAHHDAHEHHADRRKPTPLPASVQHYAIAATLSERPGKRIGRLLGDGLVHPSSATGRHADPALALAIPEENTRVLHGIGHLALLRDPRVLSQLAQWLACTKTRTVALPGRA